METDTVVCGWTIYAHPPDFPEHYAVCLWFVEDQGYIFQHPIVVLCESLDEARAQIPSGTVCVPREEADEPTVVETWL